MKVLLVDDDADLLDVTAYALRREGFNVLMATDGPQAVRRWQNDQPDVVVLDIGLPNMSGFDVCKQIREDSTTPVIFLSALHGDDPVTRGFQLGADDYVTKPFSPRQLAMRLRAVWRRGSGAGKPEPAREIRVGDVVFDMDSRTASRGGQTIRLTRLESRILFLLMSNAGRVVTSERLVEYTWGYEEGETSLLKAHICHIRKKLELPQKGPGAIVSVSGVGYQFNKDRGEAAS
jgi:DNA-binding response OmpR family regulator